MKRVLLVEDNRDIANMLFDYFECLGVDLDYADNGELGLKLALEHTFDVILLDLMLPRMDGLTVCNKLREQAFARYTGHELRTPLTVIKGSNTLLKKTEKNQDNSPVRDFSQQELSSIIKQNSTQAHEKEVTINLHDHS